MPVETLEKPGTETPALEDETEEKEPTDEEIKASVKPGKANALDPDFLLIFIFAGGTDALDLILDTVGLPSIIGKIIGILLDGGTFVIIGGWMYWKGKQFTVAGKLGESLKGVEGKVATKIQVQIAKKASNRALRRVIIRVVPALVVEFIPGVGIFTSWTVAVISMLF